MGLGYLDRTYSSAYIIFREIVKAYLVLDELQVPELINQERLIRRVEEGSSQHPLKGPGDFIVVHQQSSEQ